MGAAKDTPRAAQRARQRAPAVRAMRVTAAGVVATTGAASGAAPTARVVHPHNARASDTAKRVAAAATAEQAAAATATPAAGVDDAIARTT